MQSLRKTAETLGSGSKKRKRVVDVDVGERIERRSIELSLPRRVEFHSQVTQILHSSLADLIAADFAQFRRELGDNGAAGKHSGRGSDLFVHFASQRVEMRDEI